MSDPAGINAPYNVITKEEFTDTGLLVERTDGEGNTFDYAYDDNSFLVSDGTRVSYENDQNGNVTREITDAGTADEAELVSEFDAVGRVTHKVSATGLEEAFTYDIFGH